MVASTALVLPSAIASRRSRILAIICAFALGFSARSWFFGNSVTLAPIRMIPDTRTLVPTVVIEGVANGKLTGIVRGGARFVVQGKVVIPDGSGAFAVPATPLLVNQIAVSVPTGMHFVASRRGKYYYPVESSAGSRLSPENRVYFLDAPSAERSGYVEYRQ